MSGRFELAREGRQRVEGWAAGVQVLELLTAIRDLGWLRFLAEAREVGELGRYSGLTPARLGDILAVLEEHGIVEYSGDRVRLSAQYEAFTADDAWIGLDEILDRSAVMTKLVRTAVEDPGPLPGRRRSL